MEKINLVVKSFTPPKNTNSFWINLEDNKLYFWNNGWKALQDATGIVVGTEAQRESLQNPTVGLEFNQIDVEDEEVIVTKYIYNGTNWILFEAGGGNSNLMIGTRAERLAYTDVVEGMEWNEIDIDHEGNNYITKYVYFNGTWVAELSTYEMVEVRIRLFDKENNDVTDDDEELIGKKVHATLEHGDVIEAEIDDRHIAVLEVEHGTEYTVTLEGITHNYYVTKVDKLTHVASEPVRIINVEMHAALAPGFYGITEDGKAFDADEIEAMLEAAQSEDEKTEIRNLFKYIGVNTSNLSAANCGFMYALTGDARFNNSQSKQWALSNVEFDCPTKFCLPE